MEITAIKQKDLNAVAKVHMQSFPSFFLTFLGPAFLKEFYKSFIHDDQGIGFVAIENGRILGAIVGPFKPAGYFKRLLLRKWYAFCFACIGAVMRKPKVIKRLFRAVFYRGEAPEGMQRALLSSIAVAPDVVGTQELVVDEEAGFLTPLGNPKAMADKIMLLVNDPELSKNFSYTATERLQEHFNDFKIAEFLHNFYIKKCTENQKHCV